MTADVGACAGGAVLLGIGELARRSGLTTTAVRHARRVLAVCSAHDITDADADPTPTPTP